MAFDSEDSHLPLETPACGLVSSYSSHLSKEALPPLTGLVADGISQSPSVLLNLPYTQSCNVIPCPMALTTIIMPEYQVHILVSINFTQFQHFYTF